MDRKSLSFLLYFTTILSLTSPREEGFYFNCRNVRGFSQTDSCLNAMAMSSLLVGGKDQPENYSALLSKSFRCRWLNFLEMINTSIGKGKLHFLWGNGGWWKSSRSRERTEKNANIPNAPQWCAKKVFKMLNYCYNLKAWKLYKLKMESGGDNTESQICRFFLF